MICRKSSLNEIKTLIRECLNQIYETDGSILERNKGKGVCERSIVFRFAYYLQNKIPNYFVDCDFNSSFERYLDVNISVRNRERSGKPIENRDGTITKRFVDVIVHKRDCNDENNLICFEIKKWNNYDKKQIEKDKNNLRMITSEYGYLYGFHIFVHKVKTKTKWSIYKNGSLIESEVLVFKNEAGN